jgi:probable phosphoglycerate mutase
MSPALPGDLPRLVLVRHGETAWSLSGQHTGLTDLPLLEAGEQAARRLGERLRGCPFAKVLSSPLQRAWRTCEMAGFGAVAEADADALEWDYGDYEGRTGAQIRQAAADWSLFRDGCPGGESPAMVAARADRLIARARAVDGDVLLFSSGHILRMIAARWLGLPAALGAPFVLGTASLSVLGYEHHRNEAVLRSWNDCAAQGGGPQSRTALARPGQPG